MPNDPILFWNEVALEAQRRDFTFSDALGEDQRGGLPARASMMPRQGGPTRTSRALAIIHLAMYDALLAADPAAMAGIGPLTPYQAGVTPPPAPVNAAAAVAGAAAVTIQALFDGSIAEQSMKPFLAALAGTGADAGQIDAGLRFGESVGRLLLDARARDGAQNPDAPYRPIPLPGLFRPDPFAPGQGIVGPTWGNVATFGGYDAGTLKFCGPLEALGGPAAGAGGPEKLGAYLKGARWPSEVKLVREKGGAAGTPGLTRTPEETLIGVFWAYDGVRELGVPPRLYNQCLRAIAEQTRPPLSVGQNAVLFALGNLAMADAGIAAWREKYTYHVARPVTGIREDDAGFGPDAAGNAASPPTFSPSLPLPIKAGGGASFNEVAAWLANAPAKPTLQRGDAAWAPLGAPQTNTRGSAGGRGDFNRTPGFPAYPSGHATFGAACFDVAHRLLAAFGRSTDLEFVFQSDELNGVNRDADGSIRPAHRRTLTLSQAIHENAWSRVYLGVHWLMDAVEGTRLGLEVVEKIAAASRGPAGAITPAPAAAAATAKK